MPYDCPFVSDHLHKILVTLFLQVISLHLSFTETSHLVRSASCSTVGSMVSVNFSRPRDVWCTAATVLTWMWNPTGDSSLKRWEMCTNCQLYNNWSGTLMNCNRGCLTCLSDWKLGLETLCHRAGMHLTGNSHCPRVSFYRSSNIIKLLWPYHLRCDLFQCHRFDMTGNFYGDTSFRGREKYLNGLKVWY